MARVSAAEVLVILPSSTTLTTEQISAAIIPASLKVDKIDDGETFSSAELTQIELYLAAHFCVVSDQSISLSSEKAPMDIGSFSYSSSFGQGINSTTFGQMADTLSDGALSSSSKQRPQFFSVGTL